MEWAACVEDLCVSEDRDFEEEEEEEEEEEAKVKAIECALSFDSHLRDHK